MMKKWTLAFLTASMLVAGCGGGNSPTERISPQASKVLGDELAAIQSDPAHPLASLAVLAVRGNAVVYEGYFGQRSVDKDLPANAGTLYRIASVSKTMTSIGFMKLVEQGRIDLDADVSTYLGFSLRNPAAPDDAITSRMLLSHTASLRDPQDLLGFTVEQSLETALAQVDSTSGLPVFWADDAAKAPSKAFFNYANVNFAVVATIIERVTQQRFDLYMKQALLDPLRIKGGYYPLDNLDSADFDNVATLYRKRNSEGVWDAKGAWFAQGPDRTGEPTAAIENIDSYVVGSNAGIFGPQGSLRISARSLGLVMRMLLNQGKINGLTILQPATVALMATPQWTYNDNTQAPNGDTYYGLFFQWGLGLQIFTDRGGSAASGDRVGSEAGGFKGVGHLGEAYGLLSAFIFDPVAKDGLIYLMGGLGDDPNNNLGSYSAFYGWEESVLRSLYQRAVLQITN